MTRKEQIQSLLKELNFDRVKWVGAVRMMGGKKTLFWDVEFFDKKENYWWNEREFQKSDFKDKVSVVIDLMHKMKCKIGYEIEA